MLDESDHEQWHSRRHWSVTKPVAELGTIDGTDIRYLAAEVQLFYKAKAPREKDQIDFAAALPHLGSQQREWLRAAILTAYGEGSPWLAALACSEER
jgi:predicted metal-dependent hydrolase